MYVHVCMNVCVKVFVKYSFDIFLSIFTNDTEIDTRLSNLETKTQKISATSTVTTVSSDLNIILNNFGNFTIRDDTLSTIFAANESEIDTFLITKHMLIRPTPLN